MNRGTERGCNGTKGTMKYGVEISEWSGLCEGELVESDLCFRKVISVLNVSFITA